MNATEAQNLTCPPSATNDLILYETLSFWLEGVVESFICVTGLIANAIAIPILLSKSLASTFNRLLVCLAVFDNLFVACCILEAFRKFFAANDVHQLVFIYFLYQLQNIALSCSIYMTVLLAVERYWAVSRPVQYHLMVNANVANPWRRVMAYVAPTVIFASLFNMPKCFELEAVEVVAGIEKINATHEVNVTRIAVRPTDLRLDEDYVFYYVHLTRLLITGIFPFFSLVFLNNGIHRYDKCPFL